VLGGIALRLAEGDADALEGEPLLVKGDLHFTGEEA
jgi:hypothetical protein